MWRSRCYEYYDGFHNLLMELYFDPRTGQIMCRDTGRLTSIRMRAGYITHGSLEYYYIYEESDMEPAYCLELDHNGGPPVLVIYS